MSSLRQMVEQIELGTLSDEALEEFIRTELMSDEDVEFLEERGWSILSVVRGANELSSAPEEAAEESRYIQDMFDHWNEHLHADVFGYNV